MTDSPPEGPADPDTVAALALRARLRDETLERLFHSHRAGLVRLATLLGAEADAEDVVAEAFWQLYSRWSRLRSADAALAYLRGVIVNLVRMRTRHLVISRRHVEWLPDAGSAEEEALLRDDQRAVVEALRRLSGRQREALVLRYWGNLSESEIAEAMGISAGAVKSHVSRGMATLAKELGSAG